MARAIDDLGLLQDVDESIVRAMDVANRDHRSVVSNSHGDALARGRITVAATSRTTPRLTA